MSPRRPRTPGREWVDKLESAQLAREARAAAMISAFDGLVWGWLEAGGPIPWRALPTTRGAREASRRERRP